MKGAPQTIYVIDDDAAVRTALRRQVRSAGFDVETFGSAEEFLDSVTNTAAGCIVLDVQLPGLDGLALQQLLGEKGISLPIIFISGHGDIPMTVQAMKHGAEDFLSKPFKEDALFDAIRRAFERDALARANAEAYRKIRERVEILTPREHEVFLGVTRGLLNKQVAAELGITEKTVKVHRGRVMEKMEVTSLAELVILAGQIYPPDQG